MKYSVIALALIALSAVGTVPALSNTIHHRTKHLTQHTGSAPLYLNTRPASYRAGTDPSLIGRDLGIGSQR